MAVRKDAPLLIHLANGGNLAQLTEELSNGADPNVTEWSGRTALTYAAYSNRTDVVRALLNAGADPNTQDKDGWSPLHAAAQQYALESLQLLLDHGAKVDVADFHGNSPLANAVFHCRTREEAILILLRAGADPERKNNYGRSPAALAEHMDCQTIARFKA